MPKCQKKEHCVYQDNDNKEALTNMFQNILVFKVTTLHWWEMWCFANVGFCSVLGCNVLPLQDTDKSKHSP